MKVANVFSIKDRSFTEITDDIFKHSSILDLFACCNSVEKINNLYEGDEIDLKMFHYARSQIEKVDQESLNVIRCIKV